MSDIAALIERVEISALADRGIDGELFFDFEWTGQGDEREVPEYTASLDAVVAMIDATIPECDFIFAKGRITDTEPLYGAQILNKDGSVDGEGESDCKYRALLLAFLRAKQKEKAE